MFEFILRKTILKNFSKEDQEMAMLLKYKIKADIISQLLISLFAALPLAALVTLLINMEHTLSDVISFILIILAYIIFVMYFVRHFNEPIQVFRRLLTASMYSSKYLLNGNAISKDDFENIKKYDEKFYYGIMTQQAKGLCYNTCFEILKCLKKGRIQFVAIKSLEVDKVDHHNDYTMHVLYVDNDWCYDTYSQRQYPLEEVMRRMMGKTYKSFTYEDVDGKTYKEFRIEHAPALKEWCDKNDCYQEWSNNL